MPGIGVFLVGLGVAGNYVWRLIIVVIFMGFERGKVEGGPF